MQTPRQQLDSLSAQIANQDNFVSPAQKKQLQKLDKTASEAQDSTVGNFEKVFQFREEIFQILNKSALELAECEF